MHFGAISEKGGFRLELNKRNFKCILLLVLCAILLYFITDTLANGGLGLDRSTGVAATSIYGASVYLLSVVGGWLADRVIGARRATL